MENKYTPEDYIQNRAHSIFKNPIIANILYKWNDAISIANKLETSEKTVKRNIAKLKEKGIIERIGADKNRYRKIINNKEINYV